MGRLDNERKANIMTLKGIQVKIGLKSENGKLMHDFPDFNKIAPAIRDEMDWSHFVDKFGGWHYDQIAGHADDDPANESPTGTWVGMLLVPENFANEAVILFPRQVKLWTELECQTFYEQRAHVRQPAIKEDVEILQAIVAKRALNIPEAQEDLDALDPDHPALGRRRNKEKTWVGFKNQRGVILGE